MKPKIQQSGADILRHLALAWLLAVTAEYLRLPQPLRDLRTMQSLENMSPGRLLGTMVLLFLLLTAVSGFRQLRTWERWAMTGSFLVLAWSTVSASFTWPYFSACVLIGVGLVIFGLYGWDRSQALEKKKLFLWLTVVFSLVFFLFVCLWTVSRYRSFVASTYDFGLFSQMFHYMKTTGKPLTTLERNGLLSHFHVHVSPIFYLMLPFFMLAPNPATLQILQAAVITSAVIPLWKIGTRHELPDWQKMLLCGILLLLPAFSGGTGYDIHENCFLTPLLLWLFYGIDRKNTVITAISAVLVLMVKEDAPVYVAVIGLWVTVSALLQKQGLKSRETITGAALMLGALLWFFLATQYLKRAGDGVMSYRYDNFLYGDSSSLTTVIKAVLLNPMKAVFECVDKEKLKYIGLTLVPLMGLPLLTRRYERYLLLIPYVLINLMSDYPYQHDVFFQYGFGSTAFLIYLTAVNLADLKLDWQKALLLCGALLISGHCFITVIIPKAVQYANWYEDNKEYYEDLREGLDKIPADASVTATAYYTPYLSQRDILYDVEYTSPDHILETEYVLLSNDISYKTWVSDGIAGKENVVAFLQANGYRPWESITQDLILYRKEPVS